MFSKTAGEFRIPVFLKGGLGNVRYSIIVRIKNGLNLSDKEVLGEIVQNITIPSTGTDFINTTQTFPTNYPAFQDARGEVTPTKNTHKDAHDDATINKGVAYFLPDDGIMHIKRSEQNTTKIDFMTESERDALTPSIRMMIICTDCTGGNVLQVYNGTSWISPN